MTQYLSTIILSAKCLLLGWWYRRLRRIDVKILWPACREQTQNLDMAKAAFAFHAFHDKAWLYLGENEIVKQIDAL